MTPDNNESPDNSFGAFTNVESGQAKIDLDKLRNYEIFFATPCYGGMITDQYFLSMFKLSQAFMQYGISFRITTLRNESLVTRARNILAAMFMESTASHLFFKYSDIEFTFFNTNSTTRSKNIWFQYGGPDETATYIHWAVGNITVGNDFNDDDTTDITSSNSTDNLRKMVKNEIQN